MLNFTIAKGTEQIYVYKSKIKITLEPLLSARWKKEERRLDDEQHPETEEDKWETFPDVTILYKIYKNLMPQYRSVVYFRENNLKRF
jgi:hypothetical protein